MVIRELHSRSTFGRWTVIGPKIVGRRVLCRCQCGTEKEVNVGNLVSGASRSCGCLNSEMLAKRNRKHGDDVRGRRDRLYRIWVAMRSRCTHKSLGQTYADYGGRGIAVCAEWDRSYLAFREWAMTNGYEGTMTIERNNVDGNYEPANCLWIPHRRQARNRRDTVYLTAFGETKGIADWLDDPRCSVTRGTLRTRLKLGWRHEEAISASLTNRWQRLTRTGA